MSSGVSNLKLVSPIHFMNLVSEYEILQTSTSTSALTHFTSLTQIQLEYLQSSKYNEN